MLSTENFVLSTFSEYCAEKIATWQSDPYYSYFFRHAPRLYRLDEVLQYNRITNSEIFFIVDKQTENCAGMVQINYDGKSNRAAYLGLIVDKEYKNRAVSEEVYKKIFSYLFDRIGLNKIIVEIVADHTHLQKVLGKYGFTKEGELVNECFLNGEYKNEMRFCMLRDHYNKNYKSEIL